ncbi:MAG: putative zinc-binding protein [Methanomicrobiales archaeon]|nr:putative zinc-binding protein [Methanomicrobiales archaeon]MDI6875743.1 putative zinc-binding protein [Methanomicrobiales archaeon]
MKEDASCVCGGPGVSEGGKRRVLFSCAGASSTGQVSNSAAVQLALEGYGILACTAGLAVQAPSTLQKVETAEELVAIDGCAVACARKILEREGLTADVHLVVTDLGVKKTGDPIPGEDEIEVVVAEAWKR